MILLKPIYYSFINRFHGSQDFRKTILRDVVVLILTALIVFSAYFGTNWLLAQIEQLFSIAYLSPTMPLHLVFLILFGLLVISNIVGMSGSFYQSEDISLILASPISKRKFFTDRFISSFILTSFVTLLFIIPVILAYIVKYDINFSSLIIILFSLLIFFTIPASIGFLTSTLLAYATWIRQSKLLFLLFIFLFIFGVWQGVEVIRLIVSSQKNVQDFDQLLKIFTVANIKMSPSSWLVQIFDIQLGFSTANIIPRIGLLFGTAIFIFAISLAVFEVFFFQVYAINQVVRVKKSKIDIRKIFKFILFLIPRKSYSVVIRDILMLTRDPTQVFQLVLLLGIFLIYIYNLRLFSALAVAGSTELWWRNFLFVSNFCMSAFIALAISTRFVFPAISVDGRGFHTYIIKSPISIKQFILTKYFFWLSFVGSTHMILSFLGVYASGGSTILKILMPILSFILSSGIVSMALMFGAKYARFDWESLSQLSVGYGNIIFMLSASAWIFLCIIPSWIAVASATFAGNSSILILSILFIFLINTFLIFRCIRSSILSINKQII
jgi:ABC-2 type transport system permease protein